MKNVLIIGGSTDIGLSLAKFLNDNGYNTFVTYNKNKPNYDNCFKCDVRNKECIEELFNILIKKYKKIDILINMAAISLDNDFFNKTKEEFMSVLEVNLVGSFLTSQVYSKYISDGVIINIASTDGLDTFSKYNIDYAASKAGLITLSKSLALCTDNKVLCIAPNWIDSKTTRDMDKDYLDSELKRIGQTRLITIDELNKSIYKIINMDTSSGDVFRIDIKGEELWIEKI